MEDVVHQNERKKKTKTRNRKTCDPGNTQFNMKRIPEMMMEGHPRVTDGLAAA